MAASSPSVTTAIPIQATTDSPDDGSCSSTTTGSGDRRPPITAVVLYSIAGCVVSVCISMDIDGSVSLSSGMGNVGGRFTRGRLAPAAMQEREYRGDEDQCGNGREAEAAD